jgi:hypothetical protein
MQEEGSKMCDAMQLVTPLGTVGVGSQKSLQKALQNFSIIFLISSSFF